MAIIGSQGSEIPKCFPNGLRERRGEAYGFPNRDRPPAVFMPANFDLSTLPQLPTPQECEQNTVKNKGLENYDVSCNVSSITQTQKMRIFSNLLNIDLKGGSLSKAVELADAVLVSKDFSIENMSEEDYRHCVRASNDEITNKLFESQSLLNCYQVDSSHNYSTQTTVDKINQISTFTSIGISQSSTTYWSQLSALYFNGTTIHSLNDNDLEGLINIIMNRCQMERYDEKEYRQAKSGKELVAIHRQLHPHEFVSFNPPPAHFTDTCTYGCCKGVSDLQRVT